MSAMCIKSRMVLFVLPAVILTLLYGGWIGEAQAAAPVKLIPASHITSDFEYAESAVAAPDGNIYVADRGNRRVQELTPAGEFVLMFGKDVNRTTGGDICTATSKDTCQAGEEGVAAGQFTELFSLTIDPAGNVYVQEAKEGDYRVDKYTGSGEFVWMIGDEVDATTKANICTKASGDLCQGGHESAPGSTEHAGFKFRNLEGNILAVGGPEQLLYVGDERRIQEFTLEGEWEGEIPPAAFEAESGCSLGCRVLTLAVDSVGDVYVVDRVSPFIEPTHVRLFDPSGKGIGDIEVTPRHPSAEAVIEGLALSSMGDLAVSTYEVELNVGPSGRREHVGALYETGEHLGRLITRFASPAAGSSGIDFDNNAAGPGEPNSGFLYAASANEVVVYKPVSVAELVTGPVSCLPGETHETDVTLACSLTGEINPEGVAATEVWFEWGRTAFLGEKTAVQKIPTGNGFVSVSGEVGVVRPNEAAFYYRLAAYDENDPPALEEPLESENTSLPTPIVAPVIVGAPKSSFVKSGSAVMFGELNPENARTTYFFEYAPQEDLANCQGVMSGSCPGVNTTVPLVSAVYGKIGTTAEASRLQPDTVYSYRLAAVSENAAKTERILSQSEPSQEGSFTTTGAPAVQAATGLAIQVGATSAVVSGTVNPDGQAATYTFELGVYSGATTQFGVVFSGPAGSGTGSIAESLALTGLQPGIAYAYRITIASGYGTATGEVATFTTQGLPEVVPVPSSPPMLAIPKIAFPKVQIVHKGTPKCKARYVRNRQGKCVKVKKKAKDGGKGAVKRKK